MTPCMQEVERLLDGMRRLGLRDFAEALRQLLVEGLNELGDEKKPSEHLAESARG